MVTDEQVAVAVEAFKKAKALENANTEWDWHPHKSLVLVDAVFNLNSVMREVLEAVLK